MNRLLSRLARARTEGNLRHVLEVVELAAKGLYRSRIPQMASALAFRTIFALIPVLVVALVVLKVFTPADRLSALIERALDYAGLSHIAVEQAPDMVGPPLPAELRGARIDTLVQGLVERVSGLSLTAIGSVGLGLLVYTALSLLVELEQAFNEIYCAPVGRSWTRRIMQYWTLLTLGALLLGLTFIDTSGRLARLAELTGSADIGGVTLAAIIGFLLSVGISTVALLFLYTTVPNTRVQIRHAAPGAAVAALLWEAGKWGFAKYVEHSTGYEKLYGSLALIPLFLFWVYITWLIVLFGLQISYGLQTFRDWKRRQSEPRKQEHVIEPASIVPVLVAVARRFRAGRTADAADVAAQTGLPDSVALRMLETLHRAAYINRVASGATVTSGSGKAADPVGDAFALARPPEDICIADVLALGQTMVTPREEGKTAEVLAMVRKAQRAAAGTVTLAELAADDRPAAPGAVVAPAGAPVGTV